MTWPIKKLEEIAEVVMGQSPPSSSYNEQGIGLPFFQGKAEFGEIYPIPVKYCSSPNRIAEANDILISVRAPVGNINITKEKSCVGRGLGALRAKEDILNQMFLFYFMKKNENNWSRLSTGSTFSAIKGSSLRNFEIPVPPLAIQTQIVERLDKIAKAQKLNDGLIQKTDELFQSLLHKELNPVRDSKHSNGVNPAGPADASAFVKTSADKKAMAGKKNWEIKKLGDIIKPQYGYTTSAKDSGNYRFIRITDIGDEGELRDSDKKYVAISQDEAKSYQLRNGDLLLARTGATFGKILYFEEGEPAIFASFLIRLNPDTSIDPFYIWLFSRSQDYWQQARSLMTGSGQPQFNANRLKQIKIPLPPLEIQKQIVAKLSAIQNYKKQLLGQKAKLKELFDSALAKSMSKDA